MRTPLRKSTQPNTTTKGSQMRISSVRMLFGRHPACVVRFASVGGSEKLNLCHSSEFYYTLWIALHHANCTLNCIVLSFWCILLYSSRWRIQARLTILGMSPRHFTSQITFTAWCVDASVDFWSVGVTMWEIVCVMFAYVALSKSVYV